MDTSGKNIYGRRQWLGPRFPKRKGGYMKGNCPVRKGQIISLLITEISPKGDGVGKVDDFAVFVPKARLHTRVIVRIIEIKTTCAVGRVLDQPSDKKQDRLYKKLFVKKPKKHV
jgi:predicted RNA-binding protein with TRAM domain